MNNLRRIGLDEIQRFKEQSEKEGLTYAKGTKYFGYYIADTLVGFCGVLEYSESVVFKNDYVLPEHRGKGYHHYMLMKRVAYYTTLGKTMIATCTPMSIRGYIKAGFEVVTRYKNGCTKVKR